MSFTPSDLGFDLNNREIATLIYLAIPLIALLLWQKGRLAVFGVVRSFFQPRLALVWLHMSLYVAVCVWLLAWLGLWDWPNLKSTLLWWLTIGLTCVHEAQRLRDKPNMLRKLLRDAFTLSVVILFVAELVSFPLWVELLMLPSLVFLTLLIAVSENRVGAPSVSPVLKILRGLQVLAGLLILGFSYWDVAGNITEHLSLNNLREFGVPLLLWPMFVPYILLLAVYMTYEEAFNYLRARPRQASLVRYARWRALFNFGWNIDGVNRLARDMRTRDTTDQQGIEDAIQEIKRLLKIEKNPPTVTRADGWSPYAARRFLEEYALITGDYHRTQWEWFAHIPSVKLDDKVLADRISYCLTGNEHTVTRLGLTLDGSNHNDTMEAKRAFDARALTLLTNALGADRAETIYRDTQTSEAKAFVVDGIRVSLDESNWGDARFGDYSRKLTIQHPKHQEDT
jgi:hypothetical protein